MSIVINHLTFAYTQGGKPLAPTLKDLTFTIEEGSFLGIIGHTGSGKSTFVKHLNGLLPCEKGTVIVDGHDLSQKSERKTVDIFKDVIPHDTFACRHGLPISRISAVCGNGL